MERTSNYTQHIFLKKIEGVKIVLFLWWRSYIVRYRQTTNVSFFSNTKSIFMVISCIGSVLASNSLEPGAFVFESKHICFFSLLHPMMTYTLKYLPENI